MTNQVKVVLDSQIIRKLGVISLILLLLTSMMGCTTQNQVVSNTTTTTTTTTTSSSLIVPTSVASSPVTRNVTVPTPPTVIILNTNQPSRGGYQPTYEDNYLLFYNGSSDYYARVTCTLRQYDSQGYFKQDYQFDTIRYIPPHSYWALSTSLTQDVLQYCKILNIISQVLPTTSATLQYCEFQAVGEFTVNNVNLLDANMTGVVENNSAFTPSMVSIQTLFYDQFDAIVAIRNNLLASPYPPPMEKKQFTTTVNPVPQFTHTMTTIIATR